MLNFEVLLQENISANSCLVLCREVKYFAVHNDFNASKQYERGADSTQGSEPIFSKCY
jgi:hypothetical protein